MKKICFMSDLLFADESSLKMIEDVLLDILEGEEVECWFYKCHKIINRQAMKVITKIKNEHPQKNLKVVDIIDPMQDESEPMNRNQREEYDNFPKDSVDRFEFAPVIRGKSENHSNRFVTHARKIDRWIWGQCDYMIVHYYPSLPDRSFNELQNIGKFKNLKVIILNDPTTNKLIEKRIQALRPEEKFLIESRREGTSFKSIGDTRNISLQSASQLTRNVVIKVQRQVERDLSKKHSIHAAQ